MSMLQTHREPHMRRCFPGGVGAFGLRVQKPYSACQDSRLDIFIFFRYWDTVVLWYIYFAGQLFYCICYLVIFYFYYYITSNEQLIDNTTKQ
jgi:hypothetical protein